MRGQREGEDESEEWERLAQRSHRTTNFRARTRAVKARAASASGFRALSFPLTRVHGDRFALVQLDEDDLPTIVIFKIVTQ